MPDTQKPKRLERILKTLLDSAEAKPGTSFKSPPLGGGLTLHVKIAAAGRVHLLLERQAAPGPSASEWKTVLNHWPRPLPPETIKPTPFKHGRTHCLTANWVQPKQLTLTGESDAHQTA